MGWDFKIIAPTGLTLHESHHNNPSVEAIKRLASETVKQPQYPSGSYVHIFERKSSGNEWEWHF